MTVQTDAEGASGHEGGAFLFGGIGALVRVGGRIQEVTADVEWEG